MFVSKTKSTILQDFNTCNDDGNIKPQTLVEILGVTLRNKLNFKSHINSICKSASCQLNALFWSKNVIVFNK